MLNLSEPRESENRKPIQLLAPVEVAANRTKAVELLPVLASKTGSELIIALCLFITALITTEAKLSYADVCKAHRIAQKSSSTVSQSAFPPLPKKTVDRTHARPVIVPLQFRMPLVSHQFKTSLLLLNNLIFPTYY